MSNNFGCSCGNSWLRHDHTPCHNDRDCRDDWRDRRDDRDNWRDDRRDERRDDRRDWRDDRRDEHRNNRCGWCNRNNFWPWR